MAEQGKIKWFNVNKGYGFIYSKKHGDVFFHVSNAEGFEFETKDVVVFSLSPTKNNKGIHAIHVIKIS